MTDAPTDPLELLKRADVLRLLRIAKPTLRRWIRGGLFPRPFYLSPTLPVWRRTDIERWLAEREAKAATKGA